MSPIGKIFIVLNLILSAGFLGWASNALKKTEEFQKAADALKVEHAAAIAAKEAELSALQVSLNGVTEQQRKHREERDTIQTEADRLKTQIEEFKRANDTMQGNLTKIQSTLGDYNSSITQLSQQKDAAIERAHEAERARDAALAEKDAAILAQRDAEEATGNANTRIGDLEGEKLALAEQVDQLNTRLEVVMRQTGIPAKDVFAQPSIEALVLDVKKDLKLVILNKGKKDEVKPGYVFDIYRGSQYKGQVRITDVQDGMSSGLILNEKNAIGRGDSATTAL
jgi:DNA repair exonuclease SbcCD ATPase subunit